MLQHDRYHFSALDIDRVILFEVEPVPAPEWARSQAEHHLERVAGLRATTWIEQVGDVHRFTVEVPVANEETLRKMES